MAKLEGREIAVRGRRGGERLRPDASRPRRTLKNLLQEQRIPEWRRDRLPLLFAERTLAYVAGIGIDADFQAADGEWGIQPDWRPETP
jgi:tRNA(Ile)-lysidine synthase